MKLLCLFAILFSFSVQAAQTWEPTIQFYNTTLTKLAKEQNRKELKRLLKSGMNPNPKVGSLFYLLNELANWEWSEETFDWDEEHFKTAKLFKKYGAKVNDQGVLATAGVACNPFMAQWLLDNGASAKIGSRDPFDNFFYGILDKATCTFVLKIYLDNGAIPDQGVCFPARDALGEYSEFLDNEATEMGYDHLSGYYYLEAFKRYDLQGDTPLDHCFKVSAEIKKPLF